MKRRIQISLLVALAGLLIGFGQGFVRGQSAQPGSDYEWIGGAINSGIFSSGGDYALFGSFDGGSANAMHGGDFDLTADVQGNAIYRTHLPLVTR